MAGVPGKSKGCHVCRKREIKVLQATAVATPSVLVRISYLSLSVFHSDGGKWNTLTGDIGPFVVIFIVMEYVVGLLYVSTGDRLPETRRIKTDPAEYGELRTRASSP
ncbi:hypothetical protein N7532_008779 [Penicillium argentinense]|uniref:DUF7702 domain-containing protein n=1 Tax=Penicillium argentinense TaxID=1131581 RepID=A0A9W9EYD2_9EURO|nr:uncharacterized protein N7532_008779 [Penicillium argentinense]KAJ5090095.1 hypothetical protein N7532_008779 [Penicillium argentinense]